MRPPELVVRIGVPRVHRLPRNKSNENSKSKSDKIRSKRSEAILGQDPSLDKKLDLTSENAQNEANILLGSTDDLNTEAGESPTRQLDENDEDYDEISVEDNLDDEDQCRNMLIESPLTANRRQINDDDEEDVNSNEYEDNDLDSNDEDESNEYENGQGVHIFNDNKLNNNENEKIDSATTGKFRKFCI